MRLRTGAGGLGGVLVCLVVTVTVPSMLSGDDDGPFACVVEDRCGRAVLDARRHPLVTVEADQVRVESRLVAGQVGCPDCPGVLRPWGWARPRGVQGLAGVLRPRRARCPVCLVTHVLLPVTVLLRRAYAVEVIGAALVARAGGSGHRRIGPRLGVPAATVRGWLRVMGARLEAVRTRFAGGGSPRRGGSGGAQGPGVAVARCARRVGGGDRGGDRPVRRVRGARPGDGVAGRRGLFGWSAPVAGLAAAGCG